MRHDYFFTVKYKNCMRRLSGSLLVDVCCRGEKFQDGGGILHLHFCLVFEEDYDYDLFNMLKLKMITIGV